MPNVCGDLKTKLALQPRKSKGSTQDQQQGIGAKRVLLAPVGTIGIHQHFADHRASTDIAALVVRKHLVVSILIVFSFLLVSSDRASTGHACIHKASAPHW